MDNLDTTLSGDRSPLPENQSLDPYVWCGSGQARWLGRTLEITGHSGQLCRWPEDLPTNRTNRHEARFAVFWASHS